MKTNILILILMMLTASPSFAGKKLKRARAANAELTRKNNELAAQVAKSKDSIENLRGDVNVLTDVYRDANQQLTMSKEQIAQEQRRVLQLQTKIAQQQAATEALRQKIATALAGFNTDELSVSIKKGKVYVSMQERLLFPSGSAVINQPGKNALAKVASVLNENNDINVEVEGHTDSIPINTKMYPDNWALSVARATAISRVLVKDYYVHPSRVIASGHGEHDPIASNSTEAGRQLNRRTEIILEPKLNELMYLIKDVPVTQTKK